MGHIDDLPLNKFRDNMDSCIDVIIVTHNSAQDIEQCLNSIESQGDRYQYKITIVDNASTDGTPIIVSASFPTIDLLALDHNLGFAKANNLAMHRTTGQYVILLNPDTEIKDHALDRLVGFIAEHQEVGAAGPLLLNPDGSVQLTGSTFPSMRNLLIETFFLDRLFPRSRFFGQHKLSWWDRKTTARVDWVMGACIALRREIGERVGWFDDAFFMYFEETDLCRRMLAAGHPTYCLPEATVVHHGGTSPKAYSRKKVIYWHKSLFYYFHKHHPERLSGLRLVILIRCLVRAGLWFLLTFGYGRFALSKALSYAAIPFSALFWKKS